MRALSSAMLAALAGQETDEVLATLLTIEHADLATPIRLVDQAVNVTSGGQTYTACPFRFVLPSEREDQVPAATVSIDNVSRDVVEAIRALQGDCDVTVRLVLIDSPNTVEYGPYTLRLSRISWDAAVIEGTLSGPPILDEPFPGHGFTPVLFPGLFP